VRARGWIDRHRRPLFFLLLAVLLLFAISDYREAHWLNTLERLYPRISQVVQGTVSTLICLLLLVSVMGRGSPVPLPVESSTDDWLAGIWPKEKESARTFAKWFVAVRWVAIAVAAMLVVLAVYVGHLLQRGAVGPLGWTLAGLAASNVIFLVLLRRPEGPGHLLPVQVYADLGFFTLLLHFSGGIENPLSLLMVLHVIIAGAALRRAQCYAVAAVATILLGLLGLGEWQGVIDHYPLLIFPSLAHGAQAFAHNGTSVLVLICLHGAIFFITASFVTALAERVRRDERQLVAVATQAIEARRLLEKAVRSEKLAAVGALAGQVAHEVNNPITVISAKGRLLLQDRAGEMSGGVARELHKMIDEADRVARIAQGLLSYCRPSPGVRAPLSIHVPVRKALDTIERRARNSQVRVEDRLPEALPPILANDGEMQQVFLNLFLNALDAMPQGGTLRIEGRQTDGCAEVVVSDTGGGISPAVRDRLFEPFVTTKDEGRGTGLGLSICLGLIRSHGGRIDAESDSGLGSRFTVALPLAAAHSPQTQGTCRG
jgi:signal transduction histidine kinase